MGQIASTWFEAKRAQDQSRAPDISVDDVNFLAFFDQANSNAQKTDPELSIMETFSSLFQKTKIKLS